MKMIVLSSLLIAASAWADESAIKLKEGAGRDLVEKNCVACHSLDYIPMNSPFLDRKGWEASVTKMIKAMGAPVASEDVPGLVDYLVRNYGKP
jgi:mono/diheme cytochrome c family protein